MTMAVDKWGSAKEAKEAFAKRDSWRNGLLRSLSKQAPRELALWQAQEDQDCLSMQKIPGEISL